MKKLTNCIKSEIYKVKKTNPFKLCLFLDIIYVLFKLISKVVSAKVYSSAGRQAMLNSVYKNLGYDSLAIKDVIDQALHPSALSIISECCAGLIICGLFAGTFFAKDYQNGMYKIVFSKGYSKRTIFASKTVVAWIMSILFTLLNLIVYFGGIAVIFRVGDAPENVSLYILRYVIAIVISSLLFVLFAELIAILFKNVSLVVAVIMLVDLCGSFVISAIDYIVNLSESIDNYWFISVPYYMLNADGGEYIKYLIIALIYVVIFAVLGIFVFKKQDV